MSETATPTQRQQYAKSVQYLQWYDPNRHGPWQHELAVDCECGASVFDYYRGHRDTPEHVHGLFDRYTASQWEDLLDAVANGLAWADNEGAGSDVENIMELLGLALEDRLSDDSQWRVR